MSSLIYSVFVQGYWLRHTYWKSLAAQQTAQYLMTAKWVIDFINKTALIKTIKERQSECPGQCRISELQRVCEPMCCEASIHGDLRNRATTVRCLVGCAYLPHCACVCLSGYWHPPVTGSKLLCFVWEPVCVSVCLHAPFVCEFVHVHAPCISTAKFIKFALLSPIRKCALPPVETRKDEQSTEKYHRERKKLGWGWRDGGSNWKSGQTGPS